MQKFSSRKYKEAFAGMGGTVGAADFVGFVTRLKWLQL